MNRRELIRLIALTTGSVVIGGEFLLSGCKNEHASNTISFTPDDIAFLDEVAETIIPKTNTPGAKDAAVGSFMAMMVTDCYESNDQNAFYKGISQIDDACNKKFGIAFMKATPEQRQQLLTDTDKEAKTYQQQKADKEKDLREQAKREKNKKFAFAPNHYYTMMKQLTILGFFTSKPGATEALRYVAVPGRWEACIPYKKGDKAWAI